MPGRELNVGKGASSTETCHAREREHPGCHDATRLAALGRFQTACGITSALRRSQSWIPAFAGMTRGCIVGRDSCFAAAPSDPFPIYRIKRNRMNIRPQFLGVDFGTSNSTVGVADRA